MAGGAVGPRRFEEARWDPIDRPYLILGILGIASLCALISVGLGLAAIDVWSGLVVALVLMSASVPVLQWVARREDDDWLAKVLVGAFLVKLVSSMVRYFVIFVVYAGNADSGRYHEAGTIFSGHFRDGLPLHPIANMSGFPLETQRIGDIVGGIYVVTGPSAYSGFLIFSTICFFGQVLIVRGFRVAVPEGDHRRFTLAVLFLPSLLFWPSSIGKEAIVIGCLGLTVYGGALLLAPRPQLRGALFYGIGLLITLGIRPHVALMSVGSMAVAIAVSTLGSGARKERGASRRGRAVRVLALVAVLGLASVASTRVGEVFGNDDGSIDSAGALAEAAANSAQGGSAYSASAATGPTRIPGAFVTVAFRPFPWEATNATALIAAAETAVLVIVLALSWRRILSLPLLALRRPFLIFAMGYVLAFTIGFSYISNFGILSRQRVQMIPLLLVVVALPATKGLRTRLLSGAKAARRSTRDASGDVDRQPALAATGGTTSTA